MRQVQEFKISKARARVDARALPEKANRLKMRRHLREINRDIDIAMQYRAMVERARAHNVAACAYAPRASPSMH